MEDRSIILKGEHHPAADTALRKILAMSAADFNVWQESFASCAIENNRLAEICSGTMQRIVDGKPVSDRYVLGLAWTIFKGVENGKV